MDTRKRVSTVLVLGFLVVITILINSVVASRICAVMLFLSCIYIGKKERFIINPYILFSLTPLTLACYFCIGGSYMPDLVNKTWILAIINIYAFIFALYITRPFQSSHTCVGIESVKSLRLHAIFLFALSLLGLIIEPLASVLWLFRLAAIACAFKSKDKRFIAFVFIYMVITMRGGQMSKMGVLMDLLTVSICYLKYYNIAIKSKWRIVSIFIVCLAVMLYSFSFATKGEGKKSSSDTENQLSLYENQGGFDWNYSAFLFLPYMYLESAWANVQYVTETQDTRTHGLWLVKPVLGYLGLDDNFKKDYNLESYSSFNTFTFITTGFKDFGYWFSIIQSFLLGFYVKKIYSRYLISRSPFDVACYVAVSLATLQMYFSNHFFMQSYPFTILILMEMYKWFVKLLGVGRVEVEG